MQVQLPPWALVETLDGSVGNGRPPWLRTRDAVGSSPTWATENNSSSWSSLECSPPCQGGDRGFKSHRGRFEITARYANRQTGQAQTLVNCRFDSDLRHLDNKQHASVGHWQAQVAVTHPPSGFAGSTPARRTRSELGPFVYRFRTRAPQARKAGSIPARVADMTKWCNWKTHDAQNVGPYGHGSSSLPLVTLTQVGQCSVKPHKLRPPGATPGPAT